MTTGPEPRIRTDAGFGPGRAHPARTRAAATNRSNTSSASSGPGAPSGWYWTVSIGSSRWRSPSTEPSLRLTWLTWKPDAGVTDVADDLDLVVLGRHLDPSELEVLDRVVRPVVAEPEPARLGACGAGDDLVPEADPEERPPVGDHGAGERDLCRQPRRIARPGRQDDAVHVGGQDLRRGGGVREDPHARAPVAHGPHDVGLQSQVHDADPAVRRGCRPGTR